MSEVRADTRYNRSRTDILADLLAHSAEGQRKTRIMYKANLSYEQVNRYLSELLRAGFIEQAQENEALFRTPHKGRAFLGSYENMIALLDPSNPTPVRERYSLA